MTEDIDLNLTLKAQLEGERTFSETDAGIRTIQGAIRRFHEDLAFGLPIAEAYKEAIDGFRDIALEDGLAIGQMAEAIRDATSAIDRFRLAEAAGLPFDEAMVAATEQNTAAMEAKAAADTEEAGLLDLLAGSNWQAALAITAVFLAVGLVISLIAPFVAVTLGAIVVVTAFTAAIIGVTLFLAALTLGVVGLGAGMFMLVGLTQALGPGLGGFSDDIKQMAKDIAAYAVPAVQEMIAWIESLVPSIENTAATIIKWFGSELPSILSGISKVLSDLTPDFNAFGGFLATMFDQSKGLNIGSLIEGGVRGAIAAIEGLLTNLFRITQWFQSNPQVIAVAGQIFGWLGDVIQNVAKTWGNWAVWISQYWPVIVGIAKEALKSFGDRWDQVSKVIQNFWQTEGPGLLAMLDYIAKHWDAIALLLGIVILGIIAVAGSLLAMGVAFTAVVDWAASTVQAIISGFDSARVAIINDINAIIEAANNIPGVNIPLINPYPDGQSGATGGKSIAHPHKKLAGGGDIDQGGAWVGEGGPEFYVPEGPGRILPQQSAPVGGGMSSQEILLVLKDIEDHLAAIRQSSPGINAASSIRRSG